ncbi:NAD(P)H-dependent oxidoreductase, partial [Lactobacillus sp.]|uniref:NAD(P)H-dependent oxidoreductase n=1 Tax=Lactobacillus sp. TaxID=1591 RepID=UPI003F10B7C9
MKTTIFLFHPDLTASKVNRALAAAASEAGFEVRDLYRLYPDWEIDVQAEQAAMEASDRIVLQFPMYWYSCPPLLKKWEDLVLEYGWAYGSTGTKLHGKELLLAVSPGAPADNYQHS